MIKAGYQFMDMSKLEQNLIDLVKEQQAKLGYRKESIRLYYPLSSLRHILHCQCSAPEMQQHLQHFSKTIVNTLGPLEITHSGERFCFLISEDGSAWVHEHVSDKEFIVQLVSLAGRHGCTMDEIFALFKKQNHPIHIVQMPTSEFDYLIYFESGDDSYYYCFKNEGEHIIYHRFLPEDYEDFGFEQPPKSH